MSPCWGGHAQQEEDKGKIKARELLGPDSSWKLANSWPSDLLTIISALDTSTRETPDGCWLSYTFHLSHALIFWCSIKVEIQWISVHEFPQSSNPVQTFSDLGWTCTPTTIFHPKLVHKKWFFLNQKYPLNKEHRLFTKGLMHLYWFQSPPNNLENKPGWS